MSRELVVYLVLGVGGLASLAAVIGLVLVPVVRIYATWWERSAAVVLALCVVGAFALGGVWAGLTVVDRYLS